MLDFKNFRNFNKFINKNILAIDYGEKVIGLASFTPGRDPYPLRKGKLVNNGFDLFLNELSLIIDDECFEVIVFGIPYLTDGTESEKTKQMKSILKSVQEKFSDLEVIEQDETLTTQAAKERMQNSPEFNFKIDPKKLDEISAVIILEDFIRNDANL